MTLSEVARAMVAPGKGILAADESTSTIAKRLEAVGIPNSEESRRGYREVLITAPSLGEHISGIILYDETLRQSTKDGRTFVSVLTEAGILPGIKVDMGLEEMPGSPEEKVTKGLDGLADRLKEYAEIGAKFCKWRAVITIGEGLPTQANIEENAKRLAQYALRCQEAGLVPMVEPEVLMDGAHSVDAARDASTRILTALFKELADAGVAIDGVILKTSMVLPGKEERTAAPEEVAAETVAVFKNTLPDGLPGQTFLSGGQSDEEAAANLNAIAKLGPFPWKLSFSYGRALVSSALSTWGGKEENVAAAQKVLLHRAKMNGLASLGQYSPEMENRA
ncbi:MAG: fructose-bisphosphate aldolase class I [Candidatus Pacebacteria bacterium]|nr:fructose-bisphosphate aldolase class I [Candidatus Paceibacterota bacterium]